MAKSVNSGTGDDIHICSNSVFSHYVQIGGMMLVQVDLLPFLMQSQLEGGYDTSWFTKDYLQEALMLMKPELESFMERKLENEIKKSMKSKTCILTGENVRIAYTAKERQEKDIYLITHFRSHKKINGRAPSKDQPHFQERRLHKDKMIVYVCPRISSSLLQLSQLVHADMEKGSSQEDISKYFR
uniref:Uncharacterized protein n=1 Tax=Arion vulgaris TaxID=1028688 RepID=A0A0B7AER2_9EUPU